MSASDRDEQQHGRERHDRTSRADASTVGAAGLPLELADRPVFAEPWEATAFALAVHLHAQGVFAWPELATELGARLADNPAQPYYEHWLAAVEALVVHHGVATADELDATTRAWQDAAELTPHGQPILLHGTRER